MLSQGLEGDKLEADVALCLRPVLLIGVNYY